MIENKEYEKLLWDRLQEAIALEEDSEYLAAEAETTPTRNYKSIVFKYFDKLQAVRDGWRDAQKDKDREKMIILHMEDKQR
eukprot:6236848-Amphidinium_carterae.1